MSIRTLLLRYKQEWGVVRFLGLDARGQRHCFTGHINLDGECYITHDLEDVGGRLGLGVWRREGGGEINIRAASAKKSLPCSPAGIRRY